VNLDRWQNFYVIVGSSAGALTGLQFVVITLSAQRQAAHSHLDIRAFGSPTVVHFCVSLLISAIMAAPWPGLSGPAYSLAACGLGGVLYVIMISRHARRAAYKPDAGDWAWYIVLPLIAYAALAGSALSVVKYPVALFTIAATTLLLLFIGIHNAWDAVTYIAVQHSRESKQEKH
jgi:hypothetical protein